MAADRTGEQTELGTNAGSGDLDGLEPMAGGGGELIPPDLSAGTYVEDGPPTKPQGSFLIDIDPDNLMIDPDLQALRIWNDYSNQEAKIPELARTIYEEGQHDPALAYETAEGLVLYDGHRRRRAVKYIQDEWEATFTLRVLVDPNMTPDRALRAAMLQDSQHEQFTEVERGKNVIFLRSRFGWVGSEGTSEIAGFLGVSNATVLQAEKLYNAPANIREMVESGQMTPTNALEMMASTGNLDKDEQPLMQEAIAERAREIAEEEADGTDLQPPDSEAETALESSGQDEGDAEGQDDTNDSSTGKSKLAPMTAQQKAVAKRVQAAAKADKAKRTADGKPKVERRHVKAAAKEVLGDKAKTKVPRISDAIDLIEPWTGPAYPKLMTKFASTFVDWAHGKTSDKALEAAWDDIADELHKAEKAIGAVAESLKGKSSDKSKPAAKKAGGKK